MSAKNLDHHGRWRCVNVSFRVTPEDAYRLNMQAATSGLTKQDFLTKRLLNEEIIVRPNSRVKKFLADYLTELTLELRRLEKVEPDSDMLDNITYLLELISKMC